MLRLLLLDDNRRGLLLLWRIDGTLVAGRDEWDPRAGPAAADAQKRGNRNGRDPNEFLLMRPGMRRLLDHDGGRLLLLIDHLSDRLDGLLRLVYHLRLDGLLLLVNDLPHGLLRLHDRGLDDSHGRGLHDLSLRLHDDGAHGRLLRHGGGLGARDVARGHRLALLHVASWPFSTDKQMLGCPQQREARLPQQERSREEGRRDVLEGRPGSATQTHQHSRSEGERGYMSHLASNTLVSARFHSEEA